jgi:pyrroline-5-carboxylate reductase
MKKSIGFIGGGRITRIILQALKNRDYEHGKVTVSDINPDVCQSLKVKFPDIEISDLFTAVAQDIVFIALHPPVIMETLGKIKGVARQESIFISLAPKITISNITSALGNKNIVRLIPNATSVINQGYNPVCFHDGFKEKQEIMNLLMILGKTFETDEPKLEAYAIASAMMPTYFWFQWYEIIEIAREMGLSEAEGRETIEQTLKAAIEVMFKSGLTKSEVFDLIPVKPIAEHQQQIIDIYKEKLIGLFNKIKPAPQPAV